MKTIRITLKTIKEKNETKKLVRKEKIGRLSSLK